jgi:hypothetical protein
MLTFLVCTKIGSSINYSKCFEFVHKKVLGNHQCIRKLLGFW